MEKIKNRYTIALQTLKTLKESIDRLDESAKSKDYLFICDSIIQRFEYSIDTFWKFLKLYISDVLKVTMEASSPRLVVRDAVNVSIITEDESVIILRAITRRNETSHAYNKDLAHDILEEIPLYYETMLVILEKLNNF